MQNYIVHKSLLRGPTTKTEENQGQRKPLRINPTKTINPKIESNEQESNSYTPNLLPKESKSRTLHPHKKLALQEQINEKTTGENLLFF